MQEFLVALNLGKIRAHLSKADGVPYTVDDVLTWLRDAGFEPRGEKWVVSEADLGHVDPDEVSEITPLES